MTGFSTNRLYLLSLAVASVLALVSFSISHIFIQSHHNAMPSARIHETYYNSKANSQQNQSQQKQEEVPQQLRRQEQGQNPELSQGQAKNVEEKDDEQEVDDDQYQSKDDESKDDENEKQEEDLEKEEEKGLDMGQEGGGDDDDDDDDDKRKKKAVEAEKVKDDDKVDEPHHDLPPGMKEEDEGHDQILHHDDVKRDAQQKTEPEPKDQQRQQPEQQTTARYAYAFVIGGCRPEKPKHRGYIYNILVSTQLLREMGSKADVVAMIQMSSQTNATELGEVDVKPMRQLGVRIKYLPKDKVDTFYGTVMRKFDILGLVEYKRVILLDGDVMPTGNLDYLFELSEGPNPLLKPNFVVNGPWEPSNAGFFMLEPGPGRLQEVQEIIKRREAVGKNFDRYMGWGHPIAPPDQWVARKEKGTNWTFLFAESDQGLLYYYTKYYRKSVSLIQYLDRVENWGTDANGNLVCEGRTLETFKNYTKSILKGDWMACTKFRCDIKHFTGTNKPWLRKPAPTSDKTRTRGPHTLWWYTLKEVNAKLDMGLNFSNWTVIKSLPMKPFFKPSDIMARKRAEEAEKEEAAEAEKEEEVEEK